MVDVYICEDASEERTMFTHYVEATILIQEYDMKVRISTGRPREIIEQLKISKNTGVYFLDIDYGTEKDGLLLAAEIREYDPRGYIIFITSQCEIAFLTFQYKVEALDFILKGHPQQLQNRIDECLEYVNKRCMQNTRGAGKTFTVSKGGRILALKYEDIMFFETSSNEHKLVVHLENNTIEFFGKMKDIEMEVGEEFIRCHRAYLVNKNNIKEVIYADKLIIMKNQAECPISYRMLGKVKGKIKMTDGDTNS